MLASQEFASALAEYPWSTDMLYDAGTASLRAGDSAAAEKYMVRALGLYPDFALARLALGKIYSSTGRENPAAAEFAAARAADPSVFDMDLSKHVVVFNETTP